MTRERVVALEATLTLTISTSCVDLALTRLADALHRASHGIDGALRSNAEATMG